MKAFFVLLLSVLISACGQGDSIVQPEPTPIEPAMPAPIEVVEVAQDCEFEPVEIDGFIYYSSEHIDFVELIDDIRYLKKVYIMIDELDEGGDVRGIVVYLQKKILLDKLHNGKPVIKFDGTRAATIEEGSEIRVMLIDIKDIGVYHGNLLKN